MSFFLYYFGMAPVTIRPMSVDRYLFYYTRFLGFPEFSGYHQWQQESQ